MLLMKDGHASAARSAEGMACATREWVIDDGLLCRSRIKGEYIDFVARSAALEAGFRR